jgi:hypothetical protein
LNDKGVNSSEIEFPGHFKGLDDFGRAENDVHGTKNSGTAAPSGRSEGTYFVEGKILSMAAGRKFLVAHIHRIGSAFQGPKAMVKAPAGY